jgi:DNA repair exonuclease SbcCD ATPase subunit
MTAAAEPAQGAADFIASQVLVMKAHFRTLLLILLGSLLLCAPVDGAPHIKCWTNKDGIRECGDTVPPEYSQKSHEELNDRGIIVERTARAKTEEEVKAEKQQEARKAEQARLVEEKARRDRVLLATFTTEEDLLLARDSRLDAIDARIKNAQQLVAKLKETRERLQADAAKQELSGKPVTDELRKNLASVEQQIEKYREDIKQRQHDKEQLKEQFAADLARYRTLKAQQTSD